MATHQTPTQRKTVKRVMHEYKHGELKTARGARKVKNPKQAIAIALSEAGASKYDTPQERAHNLRRTKTKEKRGETGQAATEGRARAARTLATPSKSATKTTRRASARKSTAGKSTAGKSATGKSATGKSAASKATARNSSTRKSATATRRKSTGATLRKPATRASAARSATRTTARKSAGKVTARKSATKATARRAATKTTMRRSANGKAGGRTRTELYAEASRRRIAGRSRMNKQQLERALRA
jgi:Family of unknown function (DUF6496)